jgi:hypothetical protein
MRLLSRAAGQAWFAVRCGSTHEPSERYYDERLIVVHPKLGTAELVGLGPDALSDSTLYRIAFDRDLVVATGPAIALRLWSSSDNPCCAAPLRLSEESFVILSDTIDGVRKLIELPLKRVHLVHDRAGGDVRTEFVGRIRLERDARNQVTSVVTTFREERNGRVTRAGEDRYRWDADDERFVMFD